MLALILGGCGFSSNPLQGMPPDAGAGSTPPADATIGDAAAGDAPAGDADDDDHGGGGGGNAQQVCVGAFIQLCSDAVQQSVTLTTQTINTSASPLCSSAASSTACVIIGSSITIPGNHTVTVTGSRPLILLSTGSITVSGVLDAASRQADTTGPGTIGPGADAGPCPTNVTNPTVGNFGDGGGGWGGSFGNPGNNGGNGGLAGTGGSAAGAFNTTTLRGGCPGGSGAGASGGAFGHGGGAVLLVAKQTLTIDGTINASGAAGGGGRASGGGGGGGSGGMIVLDAATVNTPGRCFANGGGGGEGANIDVNGNTGGHSSAPSTTGGGGKGTAFGGDGGAGGFGTAPNGSPGNGGGVTIVLNVIQQLGGGGGGGGGSGVIKVFAAQQVNTTDSSKVAPLPTR